MSPVRGTAAAPRSVWTGRSRDHRLRAPGRVLICVVPVPTALAIQKGERPAQGFPKDGKIRIGMPVTIFPTEALTGVGLILLTVAGCGPGWANPGTFQLVIPVSVRLSVGDASSQLPTPLPLAVAGPPPLLNPRNRQLIVSESASPENVLDNVPPTLIFRIGTVPVEMIVNGRGLVDALKDRSGSDAAATIGTNATTIARSSRAL